MGAENGNHRSIGGPLVVVLLAAFGSLALALVCIFLPELQGVGQTISDYDPKMPRPSVPPPHPRTIVNYLVSVVFVAPPLLASLALLLTKCRPWLAVVLMMATVVGLVDLLAGLLATVGALFVLSSAIR